VIVFIGHALSLLSVALLFHLQVKLKLNILFHSPQILLVLLLLESFLISQPLLMLSDPPVYLVLMMRQGLLVVIHGDYGLSIQHFFDLLLPFKSFLVASVLIRLH
jgi:hypothetical protein